MVMTKEKFERFVKVQRSNKYNMMDPNARIVASLEKEDMLDIMKNYNKYEEMWKINQQFDKIESERIKIESERIHPKDFLSNVVKLCNKNGIQMRIVELSRYGGGPSCYDKKTNRYLNHIRYNPYKPENDVYVDTGIFDGDWIKENKLRNLLRNNNIILDEKNMNGSGGFYISSKNWNK